MSDGYKRYELGESIASGGMGEILLARDIELNREVALKRMLFVPDEASGPESVRYFERFLEEAQITAQLDHPSIVPIHSIGFDDEGRAFYTMRLVQGRELGAIFRMVRDSQAGWNETRVIGILIKVCQAVAFAHGKGIAHRDLKPSNIMVGDLGEVYVMDWGLAKAFECLRREAIRDQQAGQLSGMQTIAMVSDFGNDLHRGDTRTGSIVGTPAYLAPELACGAQRDADPQGDVYALGAVLYQLLADHAPYMGAGESTTAEEVIKAVQSRSPSPIPKGNGISPELQAICDHAMAREKSRRYGTCLELAEDLQAYLEGRVVRAYESGNVARMRKWVLRNRVLAFALTLTLLALVAVAWISTWSSVELTRALKETEQERERTVRVLAESFFLQGLQYAEQREMGLALSNWAQALHYDPRHHAAAARIASTCLQYPIPLPAASPIRGDETINEFASDSQERFFAANEDDQRVRLWDRRLGAWTHQWEFDEVPRRMAFQPRGTLLVAFVVHQDWRSGEIHWLDLETGKRRWPTVTLDQQVTGLEASFSKDGRFMAALGKVWSMEDGRVVLAPQDEAIVSARARFGARTALSDDGNWLLVGAKNGTALVYDVEKRTEVGRWELGRPEIEFASLAWSRDAGHFACSLDDGMVLVIDRDTMRSVGSELSHEGPVHSVFVADGRTLVTAGEEGLIRIWDVMSARLLVPAKNHGSAVRRFSVSNDGTRILSVGTDGRVRLWSAQSGEALCESVRFCVDGLLTGEHLATLNTDGSLELWRVPLAAARPIEGRFVYQESHLCVALSPDGAMILGPGVQAVSARTGKVKYRDEPLTRFDRSVIAVSPDSTEFAVTTGYSKLSLRSTATGGLLKRISNAPFEVKGLTFSPSGNKLAAIGYDGLICVWECDRLDQPPVRMRRQDSVGMPAILQFSAAESELCLSVWGGGDFAWDLKGGETIASLPQGSVSVYSRFQSEDQLIALTGLKTFDLWDSLEGGFREGFEFSHNLTIVGADFSADGRFLATASHDSSAKIWDLESGQAVGDRLKHQGDVYGLSFSPDGARVLTYSADSNVDLWDRQTSVRLSDTMKLPVESGRLAMYASHGLQALVVGGTTYSLLDLPPPSSVPVPSWWGGFAESVAGFRIRRVVGEEGDERINSEQVPQVERLALWSRLRQLNEGANPYLQIAQWFLAPVDERANSPYQQLSQHR